MPDATASCSMQPLAAPSSAPTSAPRYHSINHSSRGHARRPSSISRLPPVAIRADPLVDINCLLKTISPETTLRALSAVDGDAHVVRGSSTWEDAIAPSIGNLSQQERSLGIRAALAIQQLRQWHAEVLGWRWPDAREAALGRGFENPFASATTELGKAKERLYLGCKLEKEVDEQERRLDEIRDGLENLGLEELERHVLGAHLAATPLRGDSSSRTDGYTRIDDITAMITATILNGLPYLSRLNDLLNAWDIRFEVLRQLPLLTERLRTATMAVGTAVARLEQGLLPDFDDPHFTIRMYDIARARLEDALTHAGQQLDAVLDALEGSDDCLPSYWIDDMDTLEADFASWSVAAKKMAMENEWRQGHSQESQEKGRIRDRDALPGADERGTTMAHQVDDEGQKIGVIPQAHTQPPEARHYWTSSEEDSISTSSSLETSPVSLRQEMPAIVVRTAEGGDASMPAQKEGGETYCDAVAARTTQASPEAQYPLPAVSFTYCSPKPPSSPVRSDLQPDTKTSPIDQRRKRRLSLPLERFMAETDDCNAHLGLAASVPTPGRSQEEAHVRDPSPGKVQQREQQGVHTDADELLQGAHVVSDSHHDSHHESVHASSSSSERGSPHVTPVALQDPFVEPTGNARADLTTPPQTSYVEPASSQGLTVRKQRSAALRGSPSSSPASRQASSTHSSPSQIPVLSSRLLLPSSPPTRPSSRPPSSVRKHRRQRTLEDQISSILHGMPVKLDLDGDFHEMNPTDSGSQARLSRKSSSLSTTHDSPRYGATHTFFRLTPAGAKRTKDESSVSLFLLHRGERVAPLRLYVRTFGESNDRVMVRVGGGWADLGEWLREYIAHHGQRAVLENWEVKTVPESRPPSRQSPRKRTGSMLGPRSGRSTPASMRPESRTEPFPDFQPAVPPIPPEWRDSVPRKRGQTAQRPSLTAANIAKASGSPAPRSPILASLSRRMSVSSMASGSMSVFSAFAENIHGPSANPFFTHPAVRPDTSLGFRKPSSPFSAAASVTGASPSILSHTPLGLAGPRARRVTITAESEAWVQDMMGKTRRPSGPRSQILASIPFPLEEAFENDGSQSQQRQHEPLQSQQQPLQTQSGPGMQMMRSFNDIDRFNKRVFLQRFKQ